MIYGLMTGRCEHLAQTRSLGNRAPTGSQTRDLLITTSSTPNLLRHYAMSIEYSRPTGGKENVGYIAPMSRHILEMLNVRK